MRTLNECIFRATTVAELEQLSRRVDALVQEQCQAGVDIRTLARDISGLNRQLLSRLYTLLAPPEVMANTCLLVMGSEGREEQILKTDQDNALIIRDGFEHPALETIAQSFTQALTRFGYPLCPGGIMVINPAWCKAVSAYRRKLASWVDQPSGEELLHLAIFCDAAPTAGDAELLTLLRTALFERLADNPIFYSRFASIALTFRTPLGWFSRLILDKHQQALDIKKGGIFPIVQGLRSFALEQKLPQTNTFERIDALTACGLLTPDYARTLSETFAELCRLRLNAGLAKLAAGQSIDNWVAPATLSRAEQVRLQQCLKFVDQFKQRIVHHFKLHLLGL